MSAPPKIRPGASRRLELCMTKFACATYHFNTSEIGELFQMLMAEVGLQPITRSDNRLVQEAFEGRREFSRIKGSFGRSSLSLAVRRQVFERDGRTCRYCGRSLTWALYHCDHIKPVSRGGADRLGNLAASCEACNRSKGAKPLSSWAVPA